MNAIKSRWTVEAGRGLCFDGKRLVTIDRAPDREGGSGYNITPTQADTLTRTLAELLNAAEVSP